MKLWRACLPSGSVKFESRVILDIYNTKQLDVCPSLKFSVTAEPIGLYSSGNIPNCPLVV